MRGVGGKKDNVELQIQPQRFFTCAVTKGQNYSWTLARSAAPRVDEPCTPSLLSSILPPPRCNASRHLWTGWPLGSSSTAASTMMAHYPPPSHAIPHPRYLRHALAAVVEHHRDHSLCQDHGRFDQDGRRPRAPGNGLRYIVQPRGRQECKNSKEDTFCSLYYVSSRAGIVDVNHVSDSFCLHTSPIIAH